MALDVNRAPQGSPPWWLAKLSGRLDARQSQLATYADYYDGRHPLAFATSKFRDNFGRLFSGFADNWMQLVIDAVEERLNIEGFRLDEPQSDDDAWAMWQANQMDAESQLAHTDALLYGESFGMVWTDGADGAAITVESARQVIVAMKPGSRRERAAALKQWVEDDGTVMATVYLPDAIYKFESVNPVPATSNPLQVADQRPVGSTLWTPVTGSTTNVQWQERDTPGEPWPLPNPLGVVPVVPLVNRPRMLQPGSSEIAQAIPVQDALNKTITDMLVASEFAGYRQRWATGIEIPRDPDTNKPIEPFKHAVDRMWIGNAKTGPDGKPVATPQFGEFGATDLTNYVKAVEMFVQHIASQTRTPPHYFYLSGQFPSGDALRSAETGLVAKARRKMRYFEEGWEEIIRLAFAVVDDPRSKVLSGQVIWRDPESQTEATHIDAAVKLLALQVPEEALWERIGYTPQEIERFKQLRALESPAEIAAETPETISETLNIRA